MKAAEPPWRVHALVRIVGWAPTRPAGGFAGADRVCPSCRRMSIAPAVGWCLIRRRFLTTRPNRRLVGARPTTAHRVVPRGGIAFCAIHHPTSVATGVIVGPSAYVCVIEFRRDGRLSLADPKVPLGDSFETTPDRRRPHAPAVVPRLARRLPCVGHAAYGSVLVPFRHLEPGRFYEALHSMRRVCSCNPPWVRNSHEDMGWGPYSDRPCDCGCPWRHGEYGRFP